MKNFVLADYPFIAPPFRVPEGYFERLATEIAQKTVLLEAGVLDFVGIQPQEHPFEVPEAYFDYLPQQIQKRIAQKSNTKPAFAWPVWAKTLAAASVAAAFGLYIWYSSAAPAPEQKDLWEDLKADISQEKLMEYLAYTNFEPMDYVEDWDLSDVHIEALLSNKPVLEGGLNTEEIKISKEDLQDIELSLPLEYFIEDLDLDRLDSI
jgi:hypothetical protein